MKDLAGRVAVITGGASGIGFATAKVVKAIKNNELYIVTHEESREFIRRRFERIDKAFDW